MSIRVGYTFAKDLRSGTRRALSEDWFTDADQVERAWLALGRQFAACRKAARLSQDQLAALADYSRSTVANVETGRQRVRPEFWAKCDEVLSTGDALRRGLADVQAAELTTG